MAKQIIYSFKKNRLEKVCASITEDKGKSYVSLEIQSKDDTGEYKPTKQLITISSDLLFEIEVAIHKLKEKISQKKLF